MFRPGDKVRLLNDAVEGVVTAVYSGERIEISDADGFRRVAQVKELVHVNFGRSANEEMFGDTSTEKVDGGSEPPVEQQHVTRFVHLFKEEEAVYAVLSMNKPNSPLNADVEIWLVNATDFNLTAVMCQEIGEMRRNGLAGQLAPRSEFKLCVLPQEQVYQVDGFEIQLLFFSKSDYRPRMPLVKRFTLSPNELLDAASRKSNNLLDLAVKKSLAVMREVEVDFEKLIKKFTPATEFDSAQPSKNRNRAGSSMRLKERTVDLHIEELVKDPSRMATSQIIAYQLDVFEKEMDRALLNHLSRITFIHGVGAGVLRSSLREALKRYDNIRFSDAPPEKFGYGATQVDFL